MPPARIIGIDENGLGPRMGPLVVTGVRLRQDGPPPTMAALRAATGLDDSKRVFSPAHRDRGEAKALGVLGRPVPSDLPALLAGLAVAVPWTPPAECVDADAGIRGMCPAVSAARRPLPRWAGAPEPLASRLAALGLVVERFASAVLCPGTLNVALRDGTSKLAVDLRLFETVAEELCRDSPGEAAVVCGKVGGTDRYASRFVAWAGRVAGTLVESRARSTYDVVGAGRVSFVRDADAAEPAVAIASVVGKYVRELWMDDLAGALGWEGPTPSGYHDAATARLAERARERIAAGASILPAGCVLRLR
jgi:ribonuclease HII